MVEIWALNRNICLQFLSGLWLMLVERAKNIHYVTWVEFIMDLAIKEIETDIWNLPPKFACLLSYLTWQGGQNIGSRSNGGLLFIQLPLIQAVCERKRLVSNLSKTYFPHNVLRRNLQLWPIWSLENVLICISGQGSCCCTLYKQAGMQITDCLVDLISCISQWAYFKSWPQVVWAGPCSPHVRTVWKNLDVFLNYLTTFHIRVSRALHSACTHIYTLPSTKTHIHTRMHW